MKLGWHVQRELERERERKKEQVVQEKVCSVFENVQNTPISSRF